MQKCSTALLAWSGGKEKHRARVTCVRQQHSHFRERTLPRANAGGALPWTRRPRSVFVAGLEAIAENIRCSVESWSQRGNCGLRTERRGNEEQEEEREEEQEEEGEGQILPLSKGDEEWRFFSKSSAAAIRASQQWFTTLCSCKHLQFKLWYFWLL